MPEKYILVTWPEIQDFMVHPRYDECYQGYGAREEENNFSTYFVPESLYEEVYGLR